MPLKGSGEGKGRRNKNPPFNHWFKVNPSRTFFSGFSSTQTDDRATHRYPSDSPNATAPREVSRMREEKCT